MKEDSSVKRNNERLSDYKNKPTFIEADFGNMTLRELVARGEKELVDETENQ